MTRVKAPYFLAVGWDKKLHIWLDPAHGDDQGGEEEDDRVPCRDLPAVNAPDVHTQDIMSCTFDIQTLLIFTGGVDGTIVGWNFETSFARYRMHEWDDTCCSPNYIKDSKSVDAIIVMDFKRILISMSADQKLRFWDLKDLPSQKGPVFWMDAGHNSPLQRDFDTGLIIPHDPNVQNMGRDQLTGFSITK